MPPFYAQEAENLYVNAEVDMDLGMTAYTVRWMSMSSMPRLKYVAILNKIAILLNRVGRMHSSAWFNLASCYHKMSGGPALPGI